MSELQIQCRTGADLLADLPALARLRIRVFRDYSYLYEDDAKYEERCLRTDADFSRRDLDEAEETPKPMVFWLKHLD